MCETAQFYAKKSGVLLRLFGEDFRLAQLDAPAVDAYVRARRAEGISDHTIHKELTTLRAALRLALRARLWSGSLDEVLPERFGAGYKPRERALTPDELSPCSASSPRRRPQPSHSWSPLPPTGASGFPLRAIVPGWYAVASVKWLTAIEVIDRPFSGHYQTEKYWYEWQREGRIVREPVMLQRVRALVVHPAAGDEVARGELAIRGVAWSGAARVDQVEVSVCGGDWQRARLLGEQRRGVWQRWELTARLDSPGPASVRARATDRAGGSQPECAEWNRLGYGNNGIHQVPFRVV